MPVQFIIQWEVKEAHFYRKKKIPFFSLHIMVLFKKSSDNFFLVSVFLIETLLHFVIIIVKNCKTKVINSTSTNTNFYFLVHKQKKEFFLIFVIFCAFTHFGIFWINLTCNLFACVRQIFHVSVTQELMHKIS